MQVKPNVAGLSPGSSDYVNLTLRGKMLSTSALREVVCFYKELIATGFDNKEHGFRSGSSQLCEGRPRICRTLFLKRFCQVSCSQYSIYGNPGRTFNINKIQTLYQCYYSNLCMVGRERCHSFLKCYTHHAHFTPLGQISFPKLC